MFEDMFREVIEIGCEVNCAADFEIDALFTDNRSKNIDKNSS